jgi:hypothetical protein
LAMVRQRFQTGHRPLVLAIRRVTSGLWRVCNTLSGMKANLFVKLRNIVSAVRVAARMQTPSIQENDTARRRFQARRERNSRDGRRRRGAN